MFQFRRIALAAKPNTFGIYEEDFETVQVSRSHKMDRNKDKGKCSNAKGAGSDGYYTQKVAPWYPHNIERS